MMGGDIFYGNITSVLHPKIHLLSVLRYTDIVRTASYYHL